MKYDPILCMMVDDTVKTVDSSEYDKWLKQNETEASNENLVKYLMEVKGFTKENAMKYAKGKTHDSLNEAIRSCDAYTLEDVNYEIRKLERELNKVKDIQWRIANWFIDNKNYPYERKRSKQEIERWKKEMKRHDDENEKADKEYKEIWKKLTELEKKKKELEQKR